MVKVSTISDGKLDILTEVQRSVKKLEFGTNGSKFIDDTAQHTEGFYAVQGINSAKLDVSDCVFATGMKTYDADFTIPNGAIIYGDFKTLSLDSGSCIAYFNK